MFVIIRCTKDGHHYVHTDGQHDRVFTTEAAAEAEVARINRFGTHYKATIHSEFRNTRQAREYCRNIGETDVPN